MKEEDVKNDPLEAEESADRVQGSCWQASRDMEEGPTEERQQRADISYRPSSEGEAQPMVADAERQSAPTGMAVDEDQEGDTAQVPPSAIGMLLRCTQTLSNPQSYPVYS